MRNLNLKPFLFVLIGFSGFIWFIVAMLSDLDMRSFFQFMQPAPKVVTADLILIGFFIKWGWRLKFLQGWLVQFLNLNGTWQGSLQTNWKDKDGGTPGPIPVMLTIKQSFAHVSCVMRTAEMESRSYLEGFYIDKERQIRQLCYSYTSKPKVSLRDRSTPHDGTVLFSIIGSPVNKLTGEYWTQRQTSGSVLLTFRTRKLLDELPGDLAAQPVTAK